MTPPERYTLVYDGSFDGLLSAVFAAYAGKYPPDALHLTADPNDADLFGHTVHVPSRADHAARVLGRLHRQLGRRGIQMLLYGFLISDKDMPDTFLRIVRLALAQPDRPNIFSDYGHPDVMQWTQWVKTVGREKHHMEAFVRFEEYRLHDQSESVYIARIEPRFDVLPLIARFFRNRYADQQWLIFDVGRGYGIYSDKTALHPIRDLDTSGGHATPSERERHYQKLWQRYFKSATITSRTNLRQHRQMMPQRYWRYLTEKRPMLP